MSKTWFEEQQEKQSEEAWQKEKSALPIFHSFIDYLKANPDFNAHPDFIRSEMARCSPGMQFFAPGDGCMAGGYIHAYIRYSPEGYGPEQIDVMVNDGDDSYYAKRCATIAEAQQELLDLEKLVPFHGSELKAFGYRID